MPYGTAARGVIQKCPAKSHTPDKLVFANDYGYLGGYQGRCGEARMMKALYEHGPIMAALEVDPAFSSANTTHLAGASMLQSDSDEEMSEKFPYDHHYKPALPGARMVVWAANKRFEISQSLSSNSRVLELTSLFGLVLGCIEAKFCK